MSLQTTPANSINPNRRDLWLIALIVGGFIVAGIWLFTGGFRVLGALDPLLLWLATIGLMVVFLLVIGSATNGQPLGALIDSTNHMSLSRLQITLWTVLTLSSYLLIALPRLLGVLTPLEQLPANDVKLLSCRLLLKKDVVTVTECGGGPLQITFPEELVIAMGISAVSFAGSSLITSNKQRKNVNIQSRDASVKDAESKRKDMESKKLSAEEELRKARERKDERATDLKNAKDRVDAARTEEAKKAALESQTVFETRSKSADDAFDQATAKLETAKTDLATAEAAKKTAENDFNAAQTAAEGLLHKNADPSQASPLDLFRGSEVGNYKLIDMGKVQMFFFTIVVITAYGVAVVALLRDPLALTHLLGVDFPPFSNSLNTLLGISHAAYLSNKTIDHTPTTS